MTDPSATTAAHADTVSSSASNTLDNSTKLGLPEHNNAMKRYIMYYTTSRLNVSLHCAAQEGSGSGSPSSGPSYYMQTKISTRRPQILLRQGNTNISSIVAFVKIRNTSRHILIGTGDLQNSLEEHHLVWEELRRDEKNLMHHSDYHFGATTTVVSRMSGKKERKKRAEFSWRKDREKSARKTVYNALNEDGRVVARLLSGGGGLLNWKKAGEIHVLEGLDHQALGEMLIVSGLAIWAMEGFKYGSLLRGYSLYQG